jgi:hypothetical protein
MRVGKPGQNTLQSPGLSGKGAGLPSVRNLGTAPHPANGSGLSNQTYEQFVCAGCGLAIDKSDVSMGHSEHCPFWGSARFARVNKSTLHELFRYHSPTGEQQEQYQELRKAAYEFANVILTLTPVCQDQQVALRKVREAVMTANAAIATKGIC